MSEIPASPYQFLTRGDTPGRFAVGTSAWVVSQVVFTLGAYHLIKIARRYERVEQLFTAIHLTKQWDWLAAGGLGAGLAVVPLNQLAVRADLRAVWRSHEQEMVPYAELAREAEQFRNTFAKDAGELRERVAQLSQKNGELQGALDEKERTLEVERTNYARLLEHTLKTNANLTQSHLGSPAVTSQP